MSSTIVPKALRHGDTIAFISPSMRFNDVFSSPLKRAQDQFERLGYRIKIIFADLSTKSYLEAVQARCDEIHEAFRDPEVKAIICTVGGDTCDQLLPHLDYDLIRANPKIFSGFSDITLLHWAIFAQTGLQTFYGPSIIAELGIYPKAMPFTISHCLTTMTGASGSTGPLPRSDEWAEDMPAYFFGDPESQEVQKLTPAPAWQWLRPGKAQGRLMGGCLPVLLKLSGTKYWPSLDGCILFIETPMGEGLYHTYALSKVRGNLADLVNIGVFQHIKGLVVGRAYKFDEELRIELGTMLLEMCHGTDFPILLNVDIGHTQPMLTVPLNVQSSLDSSKDEFSLLEHSVLVT